MTLTGGKGTGAVIFVYYGDNAVYNAADNTPNLGRSP